MRINWKQSYLIEIHLKMVRVWASECGKSMTYIELKTKVQPKVNNHREGGYKTLCWPLCQHPNFTSTYCWVGAFLCDYKPSGGPSFEALVGTLTGQSGGVRRTPDHTGDCQAALLCCSLFMLIICTGLLTELTHRQCQQLWGAQPQCSHHKILIKELETVWKIAWLWKVCIPRRWRL